MSQQVQSTFDIRLLRKDIRLEIEMVNPKLKVFAEPVTLRNEVINNLISNAIKFSKHGNIIKLKVEEEGEHVRISVIDHGVGMTRELSQEVFDEFKETSRLGTEGEQGTGFGLPIVKHLVNAYGGFIKVESRSEEEFPTDHGTTFQIFLKKVSIPEAFYKKAI